jgi:hypothetical protein
MKILYTNLADDGISSIFGGASAWRLYNALPFKVRWRVNVLISHSYIAPQVIFDKDAKLLRKLALLLARARGREQPIKFNGLVLLQV